MAEFISQRLVGRLAAVLFIVGGLLGFASLALPNAGKNSLAIALFCSVSVVSGIVTWELPWQRWSRRATLPLVPYAILLIAVGTSFNLQAWSYGVFWIIIFVWIGVAHPRYTSIKFAPLALAGYITPFFTTNTTESEALGSAGIVLPVCLLVGESLAWISGLLRQAEKLDLRRMADMESLLDATVSLARQSEAIGAANLVAELAVRLLRGNAAVVLLADPTGTLRGTGGHKWQGRVQALEATWLDQPARNALTSGEITTHEGGVVGQLTRATGGAPALFLPLLSAAGPLGLVMITFPAETKVGLDAFTSGLGRTFATQASLAFERLRATQVLVDASMRDALTGVGNRRQADLLLAQVKPGDAVALIDLDHFKTVNDRYGHATGDDVLSDVAGFLDRSLRDGDAVARWGGEEFVVFLRQAGDNARGAIERLAESWRRSEPVVTFSAGVAVHAEKATPEDTLGQADAALYQAKAAGRDCVRLAGEAQPDDVRELA